MIVLLLKSGLLLIGGSAVTFFSNLQLFQTQNLFAGCVHETLAEDLRSHCQSFFFPKACSGI